MLGDRPQPVQSSSQSAVPVQPEPAQRESSTERDNGGGEADTDGAEARGRPRRPTLRERRVQLEKQRSKLDGHMKTLSSKRARTKNLLQNGPAAHYTINILLIDYQ